MLPLIKQKTLADSAHAEENGALTSLVLDTVMQSQVVLACLGSCVTLLTVLGLLPSETSRSSHISGVYLVLFCPLWGCWVFSKYNTLTDSREVHLVSAGPALSESWFIITDPPNFASAICKFDKDIYAFIEASSKHVGQDRTLLGLGKASQS